MFKWAIAILMFFETVRVSSQNSLLNIPELNRAKEDSVKCRILDLLIEKEPDPKIWMIYNEEMIHLATARLKNLEGKERFIYLKYLANGLNNKGFDSQDKGDIDSTLNLFWGSLAIRYDIKDKLGVANSLNNIGHVFFKLADFKKASEYYLKAIKVQEEIKDSEGLAISYNNLGSLYDRTKRPEEAIELFNKSLEIRLNNKDLAGQAYCYNNLGKIYSDNQDLKRALEYHLKALDIREALHSKNQTGTSYNNIGLIYLRMNDFEKGKLYLEKALKIHVEIEDKQGESVSLKNLGFLYRGQNNNDRAIEYFSRSLKIARTLGYPEDILWPSKGLYEIHKEKGNYRESLEMLELFQRMRDSVHKNTVTKRIPVITIKDPTGSSNESLACEELEKEKLALNAQLLNKNTYILLLTAGFTCALIFIIITFLRRRS
ncbi:MAG: tetratricopeptide repeat protein [Bacteroidetes bacterium]|nr:tetratricopeptide repeat protein [Bacteroidota bacterium]